MRSVRSSQLALEGIEPYDPKYLPADALMSANENPENVPAPVLDEIERAVRSLAFNRYPDPLANELRDLIAQENGLARENVLIGNGGDELLFDIALAWGGPGRTFLNVPPTFSVYEANARLTGTTTVNIARRADYAIDEEAVLARVGAGDVDYLIITSPNNPTGDLAGREFLCRLLEATDALVVVDEAYFEFAGVTMVDCLERFENLLILRTFSKAYSLAGVRLGYLLGSERVIRELIKVRQPYSVDAVSQAIGCAVCRNRDLFAPGIARIVEERDRLAARLRSLPGVEVHDSAANYLLARIPEAGSVWESLYERGVLVRDFSRAPGLEGCLRISVGSPEENGRFIEALSAILNGTGA